MVLVGVSALLCCKLMEHLLAAGAPPARPGRAGVVHAALVPATLALAAAVLAACDPRIPRQDVYQARWLLWAVASVPLQWFVLALVSRWPAHWRLANLATLQKRDALVAGTIVLGLMGIGLWLRLRGLETEPLHWDEAEVYRTTKGFLERGFPSVQVHEDLPPAYNNTSELLFVSTGLGALAFNDPRYVVRVPAVCWSVWTIGLLYIVGRQLFNRSVGLIAATLYTLSPVCIAMSNFGRYFCQLQCLTLLTVYLFWLCVKGAGPLNRRALWLTAGSFVAMYLTWEVSALIALGMMVAALVHRCGRLHTILGDWHVWAALGSAIAIALLQFSHRTLQQTQFLWYGTSISDLTLRAMWRFPTFQPWYYIKESTWNQDTLLPMLGLLGAGLLAIRHPFQRALRFLLIIHVGTCLLLAAVIPVQTWRYIHHQVPLAILLASAVLAAVARGLSKLAIQPPAPAAWQWYGRVVAGLTVGVLVLLASGMTVHLPDLTRFRVEGYGTAVFKFPNLGGAAAYLRAHREEGDVLLCNDPQQLRVLLGIPDGSERPLDYWLASTLYLPATLDDKRPVALDRRDGTPMIGSLESLRDLFARHERIWYVVQPGVHGQMTTPEVSSFLRQHMDVVYEDWQSMVLVRDRNHRTAEQRLADERALRDAKASYLP
jgi:hypothetical protein